MLQTAVLLCFLFFSTTGDHSINGEYVVANALREDYTGELIGEYFDVYSPKLQTRYSEVYWTMQEAVPLPQKILERFNNSVMAITGYEIDIVRIDENGTETRVPCYEQYNHHYIMWLKGKYSKLTALAVDDPMRAHMGHGGSDETFISTFDDGSNIPTSSVFSEGNGNEHRKSFHGYPKKFAQLLDSPNEYYSNPMIINIGKPGGGRCVAQAPHEDGSCPAPKNSWAPKGAVYSGILECPCTDRKEIKIYDYWTLSKDTCHQPPVHEGTTGLKYGQSMDDCFAAAKEQEVTNIVGNMTTSTKSRPAGCYYTTDSKNQNTLVFNKDMSSTATCGRGEAVNGTWGNSTSLVSVHLHITSDEVTITLSGPSDVWFGVGFDAKQMKDVPYAIIILGNGTVEEHKLGNYNAGKTLGPSVKVLSNNVVDGTRTIALSRLAKGKSSDYFTFSTNLETINFINAIGTTANFVEHKQHAMSSITMVSSESSTCLCKTIGSPGTIDGSNFDYNCAPFPTSDLLAQNNPSCNITTYTGGLHCCSHQSILLDSVQKIPEPVDTFYMKLRYYFETYRPDYHLHLFRLYWTTEAHHGEYDIVKCPAGTPSSQCVDELESRFKVADMFSDCSLRNEAWCADQKLVDSKKGIYLIYAAGHCHAPSCISLELWNADTGHLICRNEPIYGKGLKAHDEENYVVAIPPCIWGLEENDLQKPPILFLNTNLLSIKKTNSTNGHHGDMASWQMRGSYVP